MDATLADFIRVLRASGVRISVAESLDAHRALAQVGLERRDLLKAALGTTLAKTGAERALFEACFERFFNYQAAANAPTDDASAPLAPETALARSAEAAQALSGTAGDLAEAVANQDWATVDAAIAAAGQREGLNKIQSFTQRGRFSRTILDAIGARELEDRLAILAAGDSRERELGERLQPLQQALAGRVRAHVERHIELFADPEYRRLLRERLPKTALTAIDPYFYGELQEQVRRMAKRLVSLHARRRQLARRGQLDFRRTLRGALPYDGIPFQPRWRRVRKDQPRIMALCDVSGSVAQVSGFLLSFLYSVNAALPKVRAFAFADSLQEVTDLFEELSLEQAVAATMQRLGERSSDYGRALADFERLCLEQVDRRTTVIVLGDARSNHGDPGLASLRAVYRRARQVIWLNPEPRRSWGLGDSEMPRLASACHRTQVCSTLQDLERLVEELMRAS